MLLIRSLPRAVLLGVLVFTGLARAADPFFYAVVDDGVQPELWKIEFDGTVTVLFDLTDGGQPAGLGNQALAAGYDGSLWVGGANLSQGGLLFKWDLPLTGGAAVFSQSLLLNGSLIHPAIGFAPDAPSNSRLYTAVRGNGGLWRFDPNNLADSAFLGGPLPGDNRGLAKFPDENAIHFVAQGNQLFVYDFGSGQTTDNGTFLNGTYQSVHGLTAVPDDVTFGGQDTLYALDYAESVLLRLLPQAGGSVQTVIPLTQDISNAVSLSLAYRVPCDGGAWSDCDDNSVPDACDIASGAVQDCDGNGVPDACDIASGAVQDCDGNGVPDSCDIAGGATDCNANGVLDSCELWTDVGQALAGAGGAPLLDITGTPAAGQTVTITLTNALANAPAWLVIGFSELSAPFKSGVLVPAPDLVLGVPINFAGFLVVPLGWPVGIPSCLDVWFQWWISDPSGPVAFTASNAVRGLTQ